MMPSLVLIATITAKPGKSDALGLALNTLLEPTRAEPGCTTYDLHQDIDTPERFMMFEVWETVAAWQAHMETDHIRRFRDRTAECIETFELGKYRAL